MAAFVDLAKPLGSAKYVQMETFLDPKTASGQKQVWYRGPTSRGVTIAEAGNELAFLVTGMYGKPVPKQDGAPLRLALPWEIRVQIGQIDRPLLIQPTSVRCRSGRLWRLTSTASGPTSTLPYRIRAGARPTNVCSARTSGGRPANGTATASSSPISTTGSRTSGFSSEESRPHFSPRSGRARPSAAISSRPRISTAALTTSGSRAGGPNVIPLPRIFTAVFAAATRANHLYSAGTTYHGAAAVEVSANMSSSAAR